MDTEWESVTRGRTAKNNITKLEFEDGVATYSNGVLFVEVNYYWPCQGYDWHKAEHKERMREIMINARLQVKRRLRHRFGGKEFIYAIDTAKVRGSEKMKCRQELYIKCNRLPSEQTVLGIVSLLLCEEDFGA